MTVKQKYHTVTYDDSQEAKDEAYKLLLNFFLTHHVYNGESINQCDAPQIEAPHLLEKIARRAFQFEVKWDDE